MTDEHVDELLGDLDRALDVEVSPAVASRVRLEMASAAAPRWHGVRWHVAATVAAAAVVVAVGYIGWPRTLPPAPETVAVATPDLVRGSFEPVSEPESSPASVPRSVPVPAPAPQRTQAVRVERVVASLDMKPLISPDVRLALRQLSAAWTDGRVTAEFAAPVSVQVEAAVIPPPIVIEPVKPEMVSLTDGPELGIGSGQ
jgi:hypothetical protein